MDSSRYEDRRLRCRRRCRRDYLEDLDVAVDSSSHRRNLDRRLDPNVSPPFLRDGVVVRIVVDRPQQVDRKIFGLFDFGCCRVDLDEMIPAGETAITVRVEKKPDDILIDLLGEDFDRELEQIAIDDARKKASVSKT